MKSHLRWATITILLISTFAYAQHESVLTTPRRAESRVEMKPHIGVTVGLGDPNDDYGTNMQYGIDVGFQPIIPFTTALEISRIQTESSQTNERNLDRINLLAKGNYNFGGTLPVIRNSYFGVLIGPIFDNYEGVTYVRLGTGLNLGADFPLGGEDTMQDVWSIGANVSYLLVSDTDTDILGISGVVKYWY